MCPTVGRFSSEASHNGTLQLGGVPLWDAPVLATPSHTPAATTNGRTATTDASNTATVAPGLAPSVDEVKAPRRTPGLESGYQPAWPGQSRKPAADPPPTRTAGPPRCGRPAPGRHARCGSTPRRRRY